MATSCLIPGLPSVIVPRVAPVETAPIQPAPAHAATRALALSDTRAGSGLSDTGAAWLWPRSPQGQPGYRLGCHKASPVLALGPTRPVPFWPWGPQGQ